MYSQFDVSKLTGKSPTTQSFLQDVQSPSKFDAKQATDQMQTKQATAASGIASNTFQWPEKIHVSAVQAQNSNLLWPQKQTVQSLHTVNESNGPKQKTDSILNFFSFNMFNLFD